MSNANDDFREEPNLGYAYSEENYAYQNEPDTPTSDEAFHDEVKLPSEKTVVKVSRAFNANGTVRKVLKATKADFVANLIWLDGKKFSFEGRDYLKPIYNRNDKQVLLKTSRQVEKCVISQTIFLFCDGSTKPCSELQVGDRLVSFDEKRQASSSRVAAIQSNGSKPVVRLTTKKHRTTICTLNHPVLTLFGWKNAGDIKKGDFVGLPHRGGDFGEEHFPLEAEFIGLMLAEGHVNDSYGSFCQSTGPLLNRFVEICGLLGADVKIYKIPGRAGMNRVNFARGKWELYDLVEPYMRQTKSRNLEIPSIIYAADLKTTRAFLQAVWAGDGHCKNVHDGKIDLCYSSTSKKFIYGIQSLMLKFGVFSTIRENKPTLYKKEGDDRMAYILRVVGHRSYKAFHDEIGPIPGKPFNLEKECGDKDQSDVIPKEVGKLIKSMVVERGRKHGKTLFAIGLDNTPSYNLQRDKFLRYCEYFNDDRLWDIYKANVYWDKVEEADLLPEQETFGVEMEGHPNFVTDGIITHNTTFLANNLVVTSAVKPYSKSLYVSPSHTQTRQFSNEKLRPALEKSPNIARYFIDTSVSTQVFEKGMTNGSYIFLRSAFRSADRTRGISCNQILALDELQDFQGAELPVIEECTSHYEHSRILKAGTPKSFNNPIEIAWQHSSQNEWMVPCTGGGAGGKGQGCGKWNWLDEHNIAPTDWYTSGKLPPGPVCKKCMRPLYVPGGRWVSFNKKSVIMGYRIAQLQVPWITSTMPQWMRLLQKRDQYPLSQFYNEVLGLSYDSSASPITREQLMDCCGDYNLWDINNISIETVNESRRYRLYAGVDWGEGLDGSEKGPSGKIRNASYTVLYIGTYENESTFKVCAIKKYEGKEIDPDYICRDIYRIARTLNVQLVGVDWGHGWGVNNVLVRLLGPSRVVQFQYLPRLKKKLAYDPIGMRYHLQRNFIMSEVFFDFKNKFIRLPRWSQYEPYSKDILAIYAEYSEYRREIKFDHRSSTPDDGFHALTYCKLAADISLGKSRRYTQDIDASITEPETL